MLRRKFVTSILLAILSPGLASPACLGLAPSLIATLEKELATVGDYKMINRPEELKNGSIIDRYGPRPNVYKAPPGANAKQTCEMEIQFSFSKANETINAVCVVGVSLLRDDKTVYSLTQCEKYTKDATLASLLNKITTWPSGK